jgi:multidrug efflux pump subunit AcrA (membrane-fusion protein)
MSGPSQAVIPHPFDVGLWKRWRRPVVASLVLVVLALGGTAWWFLGGARSDVEKRRGPEPTRALADEPVPAVPVEEAPKDAGAIRLTEDQQRAIGLRITRVSSGSTRSVVSAPGRVAPNATKYAFITPRAPGVVRTVNAQLGQDVKAGDLLATIDSAVVGDARLQLYTQLQSLELAKTQADWQETIYRNTLELINRLKNGESTEDIQRAFASRPVGENRERLMTAYAQYRLGVVTMDRNRELYAQKLITPKQFQQSTATFEVAQSTYQGLMDQMGFDTRLANIRAQQALKQAETAVRAARERLRILGVKPDGTEPKVERGHVVGVKPDGTLPAPADEPASDAAKSEKVLPSDKDPEKLAVEPVGTPPHDPGKPDEAPVSTYSIWAPFDGTILDREMIVPGVPVDTVNRLFTLADLSTVYVEANIHEQDFDLLRQSEGGAVRFRSPAYPDQAFEGEVIYTGDLVDETSRTVRLFARAKNPERALKPGMFVRVEILNPTQSVGIQLPASAVLTMGSHTFVYVQVGPGEFVQRPVTVGEPHDGMVPVLSGLSADEQVVVEGAFKLKSKDTRLARTEP